MVLLVNYTKQIPSSPHKSSSENKRRWNISQLIPGHYYLNTKTRQRFCTEHYRSTSLMNIDKKFLNEILENKKQKYMNRIRYNQLGILSRKRERFSLKSVTRQGCPLSSLQFHILISKRSQKKKEHTNYKEGSKINLNCI